MNIQRYIDKERVDGGDKEVEKSIMVETEGEIGGEIRLSELVKGRYRQKGGDGVSFKQTVGITPNTNGLH